MCRADGRELAKMLLAGIFVCKERTETMNGKVTNETTRKLTVDSGVGKAVEPPGQSGEPVVELSRPDPPDVLMLCLCYGGW